MARVTVNPENIQGLNKTRTNFNTDPKKPAFYKIPFNKFIFNDFQGQVIEVLDVDSGFIPENFDG